MSIQHPEAGGQLVPLMAEGFDMNRLNQTRDLLLEEGYEVIDGGIVQDRATHKPYGEIEVRPSLSPEARMKLSRALGVMTTARASRNLAA